MAWVTTLVNDNQNKTSKSNVLEDAVTSEIKKQISNEHKAVENIESQLQMMNRELEQVKLDCSKALKKARDSATKSISQNITGVTEQEFDDLWDKINLNYEKITD